MKKLIVILVLFIASCQKEMPAVKTADSVNDLLMKEYGFKMPYFDDSIFIQGWNVDGFNAHKKLWEDECECGLQWSSDSSSKRIISHVFK